MNKDRISYQINSEAKSFFLADSCGERDSLSPVSLDEDNCKYNYDSTRDDYLTPHGVIMDVLSEYGVDSFDCDTCCTLDNIPAKFRYRKDGLYLNSGEKVSSSDGLTGTWFPFNWCNPPFPLCKDFIKKAAAEQKKGHTTVMLIPARVETKYWSDYILDKQGGTNRVDVVVRFLRKGLCFWNPETFEKMPVFKNALAIVTFVGNAQTKTIPSPRERARVRVEHLNQTKGDTNA